mmetsp:Transcript_67926/g.134027  ORF Transcript_67926/g.134027 Transcript_67926/m.134027 type:complete len:208 (-) Transcript_67926:680-1303(-)
MPVVVSFNLSRVFVCSEGVRCVVNFDVGSESQLVPEDNAIQCSVASCHEVKVCLPTQFHLTFCEVKIEHVMNRPQCAPRFSIAAVQVSCLVECTPTGLIPSMPIEAVRTRPTGTDDLTWCATNAGSHWNHQVASCCNLLLEVVDLGQDAFSNKSRVEELVVKNDAVHLSGEIVDILSIRIHDSQVLRWPVHKSHLTFANAIVAGNRH